MRRHELSDYDWRIIRPLLPNKPRGVPRVDDRRVLNGILWRFRTGSPWRDIPERYGPSTTCYNRFVRWRRAGVWDRLLEAGKVERALARGQRRRVGRAAQGQMVERSRRRVGGLHGGWLRQGEPTG